MTPRDARHARAYGWLLRLLPGRDAQARVAIEDDAARLLEAARRQGMWSTVTTWMALLWDLAISGAAHDLIRALRSTWRAPGFAVTVSLLLGVGVAAATTLFALVYAVLLKPLPYTDPERLVMVWEANPTLQRPREGPSPGNLDDWAAHNEAFDALTGWWTASATLRGRDGSTPVTGVQVTRGFFEVFRRAPLLGRTFAAGEYDGMPSITAGRIGGREPVLVLSHRLWQSLGADPALVGGTLHIEGRTWRVLGVMPPDFAVPDVEAGFWTPWDVREAYKGARFPDGPPRDFRFLSVVGRVKPHVSLEAAEQRLNGLAARLAADHPRTNAGWGVRISPLREELARSSRTGLVLVLGAVLGLLLLVSANVAGLSIARGTMKARETAIRLAIGAGRARLVREHITESALCAALAAVTALVLTSWMLGAALAFAPSEIPRLHEVTLDAPILGVAVVLAVVATIVGVVVPGLRGRATALATTLKDSAPIAGQRASQARRAVVVAEVAITVILLVGAGLLARSFARLQRVDPGFDMDNLLVLRITPDVTRYRGPTLLDYYGRVFDAIRQVPGVASVAAVTALPMSHIGSHFYRPYWVDGTQPEGDALREANVRMATPGYFGALGLPLVSGRDFTAGDTTGAPPVVVINESLARVAWKGEDPVGRMLVLDYQNGPSARQVVGVVRDARYDGPRSEPAPEMFIPHAQNPYLVMNVIVRTKMDPEAVASTARAQALSVDPDQPVHSVTTMARLLDDTLQQDRFAMLFLAIFAGAGLVTAATGVYALLAYTVAQRRREIAVRMAIGASSSSVARLVLLESLTLALVGCALGAIGVLAASRLVRTMLFGVAPQDPVTLAAAGVVLLLTVIVASWIPARRAARIDPVSAMRI